MINLGILGCSEIAFRRFMPAVQNIEGICVKAVAEEYDPDKLKDFHEAYGIETETSFVGLIDREDIDAVYVPQPPALHFKWAQYALEKGKHVLIEKPSTTELEASKKLVSLADSKGLALHENYMFQYHSQIRKIQELISDGRIGAVRLIRADFGFPMRMKNDFRYNAALGGGALLDAGGYTTKLATILLGDSIKVDAASINMMDGFEVDMYGSASFSNDMGTVCQIAFGMDCSYRCSLEVWGSKAKLFTNRVFTAPPEFKPTVQLESNEGIEEIVLEADGHFEHSIEMFVKAVSDDVLRKRLYGEILLQSKLIDEIRSIGKK